MPANPITCIDVRIFFYSYLFSYTETLALSHAGHFYQNFIVSVAVFPPVQMVKGSHPADSLNQYPRFVVCRVKAVGYTHQL